MQTFAELLNDYQRSSRLVVICTLDGNVVGGNEHVTITEVGKDYVAVAINYGNTIWRHDTFPLSAIKSVSPKR